MPELPRVRDECRVSMRPILTGGRWLCSRTLIVIALCLIVVLLLLHSFFFFFFQAEDGIRDTSVTGVQTCALPIRYRRDASAWSTTMSSIFSAGCRSAPKSSCGMRQHCDCSCRGDTFMTFKRIYA